MKDSIWLFRLSKDHRKIFGDDRPRGYYLIVMKLFDFWAMHPLRPELCTMYQNRPKEEQEVFKEKHVVEYHLDQCKGIAPSWHFGPGIHRSWQLINKLPIDGEIKVPCVVWRGVEGERTSGHNNGGAYFYEGHHRTGAAKTLGWKTVPALVIDAVDRGLGVANMTEQDREEMKGEQVKRCIPNTSHIHGLKIRYWNKGDLNRFMYPRPHDPSKYYMKGMFIDEI